jgi:hypothetical protein
MKQTILQVHGPVPRYSGFDIARIGAGQINIIAQESAEPMTIGLSVAETAGAA